MSKIYTCLAIGFGIAVALGASLLLTYNKGYNKGYKQAELVAMAEATVKSKETNQKIADLQKQIKKLNDELSADAVEFLKREFPAEIKEAWDDKTLFVK